MIDPYEFIGTKPSHFMGIQKKPEHRLPGNVVALKILKFCTMCGPPGDVFWFINPMKTIVIGIIHDSLVGIFIDAWGHHAHQQRTSISVTVQPSLGLLI